MQSDIIAKSDMITSDWESDGPRSDFGPKSDDSARRILKSKNGIGLSLSSNWAEPGTRTAAVRRSHRCTSNDRCVEIRIQPRCANAVAASLCTHTLYIASCRWTRARTYCRDQEELRTQRASFVATYHTRVHHSSSSSSRSSSWWARMLGWKKYHVECLGTSLRRQNKI